MPHRRNRSLTGLTGVALGLALVGTTVLAPAPALAAPAGDPVADRTPSSAPGASTASSAERPVPASVVPTLRWGSCGGAELAAFQCATAQVPLDYDRPRGKTITLALTRLPASDPARRIGTLFTNPGGPGGSGVDFVQTAAPVAYSAQVRARFDILGFDPRGVARSTPATCFATEAEEVAWGASSLPYPVTRAEEKRYVREARTLAQSCAATSRERFNHISTANVARDMDLLRRAVGDRQLSYAGYSYGTFLGATYARLFPREVRALVLDGTIDPREYSGTAPRFRGVPVGVRIEQDRGGDEVFEEFLARCRAAGPQRCSLAGVGEPGAVARRVLDGLEARPLTVALPDGTTTELTYQLAVVAAYSYLYSPATWAELADFLTEVAIGQRTRALQADAGVAALLTSARRTQDYASAGGSLGSTCVDTRTPHSVTTFARTADRQDRRFPDFGRYRAWTAFACQPLAEAGIRDRDAYTGPWRQTTKARVMVLGTRFDPATPYRNTRPYADLFRRASVTTLAGWGHTTLGQSRCVDEKVTSYLLNPAAKRSDATCGTDLQPFAAPTTTPSRTAARTAVDLALAVR
ncbi:pimeloyl-ACP methyl ester carboxylesterase [Microlunatus capsulatus]|uniref:Pimeloyl-ACP methyl ester carboxylesterase n=1 Tax=Microlunatus capsulatus TaxID=99117 RepID=A0ABS4Z7L4_9ACTN|nr:alpha/beta fold hydrolase [Microlunatus capsulatus]MBP2417023.1 pimeloyl-ACP methyl ester carboxylesterase [Microlunatus capsulatus]